MSECIVYVVTTLGERADGAVIDDMKGVLSTGTAILNVTAHIRESADAVLAAAGGTTL